MAALVFLFFSAIVARMMFLHFLLRCLHARRTGKRGFNLIESAIVLGVVGLVLGGSWVAISTVRENIRVNSTYENAAFVISRLRETFFNYQRTASNVQISNTSLINMGIIPREWISGGNTIKPPYFTSINVYLGADSNYAMHFYLNAMNESMCQKLGMKFIMMPIVRSVMISNGSSWVGYNQGSPPAVGTALNCNTNGNSNILIYFDLVK